MLAVKAGAELCFGEKVTGVVTKNRKVVGVKVDTEGGEKVRSAQVIVDATGMARVVRRKVPGFQLPEEARPFSVYMEDWTDMNTIPGKGIHSFAGSNVWTAEYPDYWIVGVGQPRSMEETKALHASWVHSRLPGKKKVLQTVTGVIPYSFSPGTLVDDAMGKTLQKSHCRMPLPLSMRLDSKYQPPHQ